MKRMLSVIAMGVNLVLMATLDGVAMCFSAGLGQDLWRYYTYFSALPLGYGNWLPMIIGLLSGVVFILPILSYKFPQIKRSIQTCIFIILIAIILSWTVFSTLTFVSVIIGMTHGFVFILTR